MNNMKVETLVTGKDFIEQLVTISNDVPNVHDEVIRRVIDVSEHQIKDALVSMGWTPPHGKNYENGLWEIIAVAESDPSSNVCQEILRIAHVALDI